MATINIILMHEHKMEIYVYEWKHIINPMLYKCDIRNWEYDETEDVLIVEDNDCSKLFMLLWKISTEFDISLT